MKTFTIQIVCISCVVAYRGHCKKQAMMFIYLNSFNLQCLFGIEDNLKHLNVTGNYVH